MRYIIVTGLMLLTLLTDSAMAGMNHMPHGGQP